MINSSKDSIEEIKNLSQLKIKYLKRNVDFLNDLLSIFISTKWNRHLFTPDNPVVKRYKNEIIKNNEGK